MFQVLVFLYLFHQSLSKLIHVNRNKFNKMKKYKKYKKYNSTKTKINIYHKTFSQIPYQTK